VQAGQPVAATVTKPTGRHRDNADMSIVLPNASGPLAAIDIGSNSFRLEIGQMQHGRYRRIDYLKDTVRLGAGLDANGFLQEEAAQRGLRCLQRFALRLAGFQPMQVRAVATQTLREARNRNAYLERAQQALGYSVDVISGREEARLIYAGVAQLQPSSLPRLVIDIGGRSTEMILGQARTPRVAESFRVGSVSLSMQYFPGGQLSDAAFRAAQIAAGAELEEALVPFAPAHWQEALGSSGTVGAVSQVLAANGVTDGRITPQALAWCITRCIEAGHIDRMQFAGLKDERRPVLPGGLAILYTLCTHFGINELMPAKGALRQGVIIDLHERLEAQRRAQPLDVRDASTAELQQRFHVDVTQAQRVQHVALALYDGLRGGDDGVDAARELGWAAELHELGMMVSHHDHHRHSAYLLAHVDAAGFSQSQQRRLADLVLAQRGGLRKIETLLQQPGFALQALCLRLAVIRCHARIDDDTPRLQLQRGADDALHLSWRPAKLPLNPRTLHLLREEAAVWARSGVLRLVLP
jgi:exopolyphosphatase/guanosine-5'-triphosphate,3'-diphosphate pyrophosphatase